jgi:hypothetical protein
VLNQDRLEKGMEAERFFRLLWQAPIEKICIENPVPSKIYELPPYTQIIEPYQF